jgi:2'-5' RNA ligase
VAALKRLVVITVPPRAVAAHIDRFRREVCGTGGSRTALAYPPHVTLRTGFLFPPAEGETLIRKLAETLGEWQPFPIRNDGLMWDTYDTGVTKYFVGYRVVKDEPLASLNRRLLGYNRWHKSDGLSFHPNLTMAFDDLGLEGFRRVARWLREEPQAAPAGFCWTCDNVGLYHLAGDRWEPYHVFEGAPARV